MAKNNQVKLEIVGKDKASKVIKKVGKTVKTESDRIRSSTKQVSESTKHGISSAMGNLKSLGNQFRYLSLVVGMFAGATVVASKSFVDASVDMNDALIGLSTVAAGTGNDMKKANQVAMHFANTGLMSVADSAMALKQLLAKGYGLKQATDLMNVMTDAAVFNRQANLSVGQAIRGSAEGIKNEMSIKTDNVGITKNLSVMEKEYAASIGKTVKKLTEAEKREAIYQGFMKEGALFRGNAALATRTLGGEMAKLGAITLETKASLGNALAPVVGNLAELFGSLFKKIQEVSKSHKDLVSAIIASVTSLSVFLAVVAGVGAILPLLSTGIAGMTSLMRILAINVGLTTANFFGFTVGAKVYAFFMNIATWSTLKFTLVIGALTAGVGLLVYGILKLTGKWDKYRDSLKKITSQVSITKKSIKDLDKSVTDSSNVDSNSQHTRRIAHQRNIEDLTQSLKEERSKGIWADQTRIRDLKKRLKRENEDWKWYLNGLEKNSDNQGTVFDKMRAHLQKAVEYNKEASDEIQKNWLLSNAPILKIADKVTEQWKHAKKIADEISSTVILPFSKGWNIDNLKAGLDEIADYAKKIGSKIRTTLSDKVNIAADWASNVYDSLKGSFIKAIGKVKGWLQDYLSNVWGGMKITAGWLQSFVDGIVDGMKKAFKNEGNIIVSIGTFIKNAIVSGISTLFDWLSNLPNNMINSVYNMGSTIWDDFESFGEYIKNAISSGYSNVSSSLQSGISSIGNSISNIFGNLLHFQEGGVVPGTPGTAVPIIAHAGETIIPANSSPITININNPSVRSDQDIIDIANAVKNILSRQQVLRHLK